MFAQQLCHATYSDLNHLFGSQLDERLWHHDHLTSLFATRHPNTQPIRFIQHEETLDAIAYEQFINQTHCVPTRCNNWHDLFNALMWCVFPRTKKSLNRSHTRDAVPISKGQRSTRRNFISLLDETGVIVACSVPELNQYHMAHQWHQLFVDSRYCWGKQIRAFILGHGLYEQCMTPYLGLTAKAFYMPVNDNFFEFELSEQYQILDQMVSETLQQSPKISTNSLLPLPVLGIPDWDERNQDPAFYQNPDYFRPKPSRSYSKMGC